MNDAPHQPMRRKLLALLLSLPWLGACRAGPDPYHTGDPAEDALRQRFRGIGIVLVVDAVAGAEMGDVRIINDLGYHILGSPKMGVGSVSRRGRSIRAVGGARVPRWVRVTWRKPIVKSKDWESPIIGDYTIPVAERIPDSVLDYIRKNGGALRLKFRLKPDGVLFGWDVERRIPKGSWCVKSPGETCFQIEEFIPGGDFLETEY